jgi:hypothetical protein
MGWPTLCQRYGMTTAGCVWNSATAIHAWWTDGTWKPTRLPDSWWRSVAGQLAFSAERSSAPARENRTSYTSDNNFIVFHCFKKPLQVVTLQFGWYSCKLSLLSRYGFPVLEWPKPKNQSLCKECKGPHITSFILIAPDGNSHWTLTTWSTYYLLLINLAATWTQFSHSEDGGSTFRRSFRTNLLSYRVYKSSGLSSEPNISN